MYPFFLTELFFFDFYNIFLCLTPTTMYVHRRRTTPCNAYKKHENEKIIHCFDPKNGCFAIHVPTTTELWTNFELDWTFSSITLVRWVLMCDGTCASALYCDIILASLCAPNLENILPPSALRGPATGNMVTKSKQKERIYWIIWHLNI